MNHSKNNKPNDFSGLSEVLKNKERIAILGIGSELMQDDEAGVEISVNLEKKFGADHPKIRIFTCHTTPENFTKEIADFRPEHIVLIDAADISLEPGQGTILPVERITDFSLGTHKMSLIMMIKFLKETINPGFSVIAIQYKSINFGEKMTKEMKKSVRKISKTLTGILEKL